jgi:hypothetical protein
MKVNRRHEHYLRARFKDGDFDLSLLIISITWLKKAKAIIKKLKTKWEITCNLFRKKPSARTNLVAH